jgi:hypothetical protein
MPRVGFEPTIPAFEQVKTVYASARAATVISYSRMFSDILITALSLCSVEGTSGSERK